MASGLKMPSCDWTGRVLQSRVHVHANSALILCLSVLRGKKNSSIRRSIFEVTLRGVSLGLVMQPLTFYNRIAAPTPELRGLVK